MYYCIILLNIVCVCVCNECLIIYWLLTFLNDPYLKRCLFNGNSWKDVSLNCYTYPTARWIEPSQIVQYLSFEYTLFNLIAFLCVSVAHLYNLFKMHTHTKGNYNWTNRTIRTKNVDFQQLKIYRPTNHKLMCWAGWLRSAFLVVVVSLNKILFWK